ncbi:hypothetical protein HDV00_012373 [Rhizophlyctis rosea]|nr:hypothetical protein HDV00_012373 [Rhizophlyctis rosea]
MTGADQTWNCDTCTFLNKGGEMSCSMCYSPRTAAKDLPVEWQWTAGPSDPWTPYPAPLILDIEAAYAARQPTVALNKGDWFARQKNTYHIRFDYSGAKQHRQVNSKSHMERNVRRIADDDPTLFHPILLSDLTASDRCTICLDDFHTSPTPPTTDPVRLPQCTGHQFHRTCIAQYVKLRGECPLCKQAII